MIGDGLKLLASGGLLGLTLSATSGCFWPCSDCGSCVAPSDDHYGIHSVPDAPSDSTPPAGAALPGEVAALAGATLDASRDDTLVLRYESEGRPVTLRFSAGTFSGTAGDSLTSGLGGASATDDASAP